jgi:hypothetical protein
MTIKDAIILLLITVVGVTIANLITLKIAATQIQGTLSSASPLGLLGSLIGGGTPAPAPASS